jgi:hypothetical protein
VTGARSVARRTHRWEESTIRPALTEFLAGWEVWPTCEQFARGGAKGLRDAITRVRGAEWWARGMGLPGGDRPRHGVRRWTDENIRATLSRFVGDRETWPTNREFDEAGLHALREALRHYGGPARWSQELGVAWTPRLHSISAPSRETSATPARGSAHEWPRWTEPTITAALEEFLAGRSEWPRFDEFVYAGRKGLYQAVLKHGGSERWAQRMGVERAIRRTRGIWSEDRIRAELTRLFAGRTMWPWPTEFASPSEQRLLRAVKRMGGIDRWADELGIERLPHADDGRSRLRRQPPREWTDARIEQTIAPLVRALGRWPTKGEFQRAGLGKALAAVYQHGGSKLWQERLGVSASVAGNQVPDRRKWTPEVVDAQLRAFCAGRTTWPNVSEFRAAGRYDLYRAAHRHGGPEHWRRELGLSRSARS